MHRILTLLDNWPAGYPANLKVGYRISGRIFNSAFKCLVKDEINKYVTCIEGFLFTYLKQSICLHQNSTATVSKRHFWKFYELIWLSLQFGRISGYIQYVSGMWLDIRQVKSGIRPNTGYQKSRIIRRDIRSGIDTRYRTEVLFDI
jgi:hypothetical protein